MDNVYSKQNHPIWNAVIWEYAYTNKVQFPEDQAHLEQITVGFEQAKICSGKWPAILYMHLLKLRAHNYTA